jgi:hypothetical protein
VSATRSPGAGLGGSVHVGSFRRRRSTCPHPRRWTAPSAGLRGFQPLPAQRQHDREPDLAGGLPQGPRARAAQAARWSSSMGSPERPLWRLGAVEPRARRLPVRRRDRARRGRGRVGKRRPGRRHRALLEGSLRRAPAPSWARGLRNRPRRFPGLFRRPRDPRGAGRIPSSGGDAPRRAARTAGAWTSTRRAATTSPRPAGGADRARRRPRRHAARLRRVAGQRHPLPAEPPAAPPHVGRPVREREPRMDLVRHGLRPGPGLLADLQLGERGPLRRDAGQRPVRRAGPAVGLAWTSTLSDRSGGSTTLGADVRDVGGETREDLPVFKRGL